MAPLERLARIRECQRVLDLVLELAHVAGPGMCGEQRPDVGCDLRVGHAFLGMALDEVCGERAQVPGSLAQRRHWQREHGQPVVEIFPEASRADFAWQITRVFGYSFLTNDKLARNADSLPLGWTAGGAYQLGDNLSLAFDLSGQYNLGVDVCGGVESRGVPIFDQPADCLVGVVPADPTTDEFQGLSFHRAEAQWCSQVLSDCDVKIQSVGAFVGPRFSVQTGSVKPFFHIMGGAVRSVRKIVFFSHTSTNFALMPGGGIDVDVSDTLAVRFQGDYRIVFFGDPADSGASLVSAGGEDYNEFRLQFGLVFKLGARM